MSRRAAAEARPTSRRRAAGIWTARARCGASAKRAWIVAGVAVVLAVLAVMAVAGLTPFKTVEPFVIRVDQSTGIVDVVPVLAGEAEVPEAVTRYFVTQYVQARERYVPALAESDYEQVGAYHSPPMNQAWAQAWNRNNPDSPLNVYADGTTVQVRVERGVVPDAVERAGGPGAGAVRYRATGWGQGAPQLTHYVATLQYAYGRPSSDDRLRGANPLGFKVLEYRREPEW